MHDAVADFDHYDSPGPDMGAADLPVVVAFLVVCFVVGSVFVAARNAKDAVASVGTALRGR